MWPALPPKHKEDDLPISHLQLHDSRLQLLHPKRGRCDLRLKPCAQASLPLQLLEQTQGLILQRRSVEKCGRWEERAGGRTGVPNIAVRDQEVPQITRLCQIIKRRLSAKLQRL